MSSFVTSYIRTDASTKTRAADSASMTGSNFSSWYSQTQGTFVCEGTYYAPAPTANVQVMAVVNDGTANERTYIRRSAAGVADLGVVVGGAFQSMGAAPAPNTITSNAITKQALAYLASSTNTALNGASGTAAAISLPTVNKAEFGSALGSSYMCGWIRRISYYQTRLPDATLRALTA